MFKKLSFFFSFLGVLTVFQVSCSHDKYTGGPDTPPRAVIRNGVAITLRDQKLTVIRDGKKVKDYSISSSKFGIGGRTGSNRTPVGIHAVTKKVGDGQPAGMVFKGCRPTGEVVPVDAAGRDPIVTRVIQIAGLESFNKDSHSRRIYIHGTPEERKIGQPASYGCIRMRSTDVLDLYPYVYRGMPVAIESCSQSMYLSAENDMKMRRIEIPASVVVIFRTIVYRCDRSESMGDMLRVGVGLLLLAVSMADAERFHLIRSLRQPKVSERLWLLPALLMSVGAEGNS